ncbi:MAG: hypothetical protein AB7V46_22540, partial [Thermomicrobiales bacterium]
RIAGLKRTTQDAKHRLLSIPKQLKNGIKESRHTPTWLPDPAFASDHEMARYSTLTPIELTLRDAERAVSHMSWPLVARAFELLPTGWTIPELMLTFGVSAAMGFYLGPLRTISERLRVDPFEKVGRGSALASFLRGAYAAVAPSAVGLTVVFPLLTGGGQVDPALAAEWMLGASLTNGFFRGSLKAASNRQHAKDIGVPFNK